MTIGLFGTCSNIRWRDPFMKKYEELDIPYFNPMKDKWSHDDIPIEAEHLANDPIVLFPVLDSAYCMGSLSEIGFGPLRAMRQNFNRYFIILIEPDVTDELKEANPELAKNSKNTRALVLGHLKQNKADNIILVSNLDDMLQASIDVYNSQKILNKWKNVG